MGRHRGPDGGRARLLVLQVLAAGFHLSRGETKDLWLNLVLLAMAAPATWLVTSF